MLHSKLPNRLRRTMTDAEATLWKLLRGRQLNGIKFRRQHPFGNYILDFVSLEKKVIVELDGGQHQEYKAKDAIRTDVLEKAGFRVLRFWNHETLQNAEAVVERIWQEVTRVDQSSPSPLLEGECADE